MDHELGGLRIVCGWGIAHTSRTCAMRSEGVKSRNRPVRMLHTQLLFSSILLHLQQKVATSRPLRVILVAALLWSIPALAHGADTPAGWPRHVIDDSSRGADGVRLGDLDGDGLPDFVTGWEEGGVVRVCLNPGPDGCRERWPSVIVGPAASAEDALFVDLDGDGTLEVVTCLEGRARRMQVHWPPSLPTGADLSARRRHLLDPNRWRTETIPATDGQTMWMFCVPLQVDGRRGVDLIVGSKNSGGTIGWLEAPADPHDLPAWRLHPLREAGWIMALATADLDHDSDTDLLFSDRKGSRRGVSWLENPGPETTVSGARWVEHAILAASDDVMFVDFVTGGNGWQLAAAVKPKQLVVCASADDVGRPWQIRTELAIPARFGTAKAVRFAALNPGAPAGLVFTCEGANGDRSGVGWLPADTGGHFQSARDIGGPAGLKYDLIELLDLDADGDLDVITCEETDNLGVIWYENPARAKGR